VQIELFLSSHEVEKYNQVLSEKEKILWMSLLGQILGWTMAHQVHPLDTSLSPPLSTELIEHTCFFFQQRLVGPFKGLTFYIKMAAL